MRCLGRSPSSFGTRKRKPRPPHSAHLRPANSPRPAQNSHLVMSLAMTPAQGCLVAGDAATATRRASADPTGSTAAIAGGAVTSGPLDDGGGVAQRVNAGSGALLSLGAGRERKRPKHQHRCTQCQCKLFHAISSSPQENAPTQICWMVAWRRSKSPRDWFICINQR